MEVIFAIIIDIYKLYVYLTIGFPNENWRRVNVLPRLRFSNELCYIAIYKISFPNGLSWYGDTPNCVNFAVFCCFMYVQRKLFLLHTINHSR